MPAGDTNAYELGSTGAVSPLSGIHLALQGRYGLSAREMARANAAYGLRAYGLAVLCLLLIAASRG